MNDPGLEEPIDEAAQDVEDHQFGSDKNNESHINAEREEFLEPSRWWAASTAIPLLAACFGPIASAFNVCALASHWRSSIPDGVAGDTGTAIDIDDPKWLLAVNGVSLALAIIANAALLLNMARRIPFKVAQPITILGWYVSSFLLISLLVAANYAPGMMLDPGENRTFTQAYYYGIWAAILYFIISSLMLITVWGAVAGHYSMDFQLTVSQRTLMLQTTSYVIYLLAGAGVWHAIEGWSYSDAVYWANYTLLTIGVGNVAPTTHAGRGLIFPYAIGGIIILGLVIGSIRTLMLERGKRKLSARLAERTREKAVRQMLKYDGKVKLSMMEKWRSVSKSEQSHEEVRRQEFIIMRRIQYQSDLQRKWTALFGSTIAGLILWFIGAVVFWKAEASGDWSYFESLYFTYTSLLTIGYGDFAPQTNAGKSFFVFWSLLAVPTLTILISNMGDTVVRLVRDVTLWLGELTILPGTSGLRQQFRRLLSRHENDVDCVTHPSDSKQESGQDPEQGEGKIHDDLSPAMQDAERRGEAVERDELAEADQARARGDPASEDKHMHRFLLIREIRRVMRDIGTKPPKKYTYDQWAWFLELLGESESDEKFHRAPLAPEDVKANAEGRQHVGRTGKAVQWSWMGERSPLLGETDEPEWVLERLTVRLEEELRDVTSEERRKRSEKETRNDGQV